MKNKLTFTALAVIAIIGAGVVAQDRIRRTPAKEEPLQVRMFGRTHNGEIYLRWVPESGWIPSEGLTVVAIDGDRETKVRVTLTAKATDSEMWRDAAKSLSSPEPIDTRPIESSKGAFAAAKAAAVGAIAEKRGNPELGMQRRLEGNPAVERLTKPVSARKDSIASIPRSGVLENSRGSIRGGGAIRNTPPRVVEPQPAATVKAATDEQIIAARNSLRASALMDEFVARGLGMAANVGGLGASGRIELRTNEGVVVGKIAVADFKGAPPTPNVEDPVQIGQFKVGLNFSIPANPADYGMITYNLYRVAGGETIHVNKDRPILASFDETPDGKLANKLLTAVDDAAPIGPVEYRVEAVDCFGVAGPLQRVAFTVADVAVPFGTPTFAAQGPTDTGKLKDVQPGPDEVRVYWTPQRLADDQVDKSGKPLPNVEQSSYTYQVERIDHESERPNPVALTRNPEMGKPADLKRMSLGTLLRLRPDFADVIESARKAAAGTGKGDGSEVPPLVDPETTSADEFLKRPWWDKVPNVEIFEIVDKTPQVDRYFRYRLTCRLERSQRLGESTETSPVGVPATVMPKDPTGIQISDRLAGISAADFASLKGARNNALAMQPAPGISGPAGLIDVKVTDSRSRGQELLRQYREKPVEAITSVPLTSRRGGVLAQGQAPKPFTASTTKKKTVTAPPTGSPANYGRIVSLSWRAPAYPTPLTYRVYRAVGTGIRTKTGLPTPIRLQSHYGKALTPSRLIVRPSVSNIQSAAGATRTPRPAPRAGVLGSGPQAAQMRSMQFVRGTSLAQIGVAFADEFEPDQSEYVLVGETGPSETTFTDVIPRGQSTAYFYVIEPVNRWGSRGSKSTATKKRMDPSLTPSPPKMEAVTPTKDQSVNIVLNPNVREEDVKIYEIYRIEGRLAVPPPAPAPPPTGPVTVRRGMQFRAGKIEAVSRPNLATQTISGNVGIQTQSGRSLAAANASTPGTAQNELGIRSMDSPVTSLAEAQRSGNLAMNAEVKRMVDPANYTKVHTLTVSPSDAGPFYWEDKTVEGGKSYIYRVVAINTANLKSTESALLDATVFKTSVPAPTLASPPNIGASGVILNLKVDPRDGAKAFIIRRQVGTKAMRQLGTVAAAQSGNVTAFQDNAIRSGVAYNYEIQSVDYAGNVSLPLRQTVVIP
jgi:hypothetical protein